MQINKNNPKRRRTVKGENITLIGMGGELEKPEWLGFVTVDKPATAKKIAKAVYTELKDER